MLSSRRLLLNIQRRRFSVAIIGSGPSGFYTARALLRQPELITAIHVFDQLPFPYGLVRYGVAPDHPEVKNCIHQFEKVVDDRQKFKLFGNVNVGIDVRLRELCQCYDIVVLAFGAQKDKTFSPTGRTRSQLPRNFFTSQSFVNWYNGFPMAGNVKPPNLAVEDCVILGHGNVALDVARILLLPVDLLSKSDISERALNVLRSENRIKNVTIVGRRGPMQISFTIAELREMINAPGSIPKFLPKDLADITVDRLARPRKRITELLLKTANNPPKKQPVDQDKTWTLRYFLNPYDVATGPDGSVEGVIFRRTRLAPDGSAKIVLPEELVKLPAGLVVSCLGYHSVPIDSEMPFDPEKRVVPNVNGRVGGNLYAAGWCAYGVSGELAHTLQSARALAKVILGDLVGKKAKPLPNISEMFTARNIPFTSWEAWEKLDAIEIERGQKVGKPREKIVDLQEALSLCR